jgi:amino acid adenylation domain-containing protein
MHQPLVHLNPDIVSVVIPAYNSREFLPAAIESVLSQTYSAIEIIVVDDGSTDDTKVVCVGIAAAVPHRDPAVKYIYQTNQGAASARNTGMRASTGNYLVFLDSDDYLFPEAIEIGVDCLKANPAAGCVFGSYLFKSINPDGSYTTQRLSDDPPAVASYATILAAQHKIQCATAIFRRTAIESVGGFDPRLAVMEDLHLFLRIARTFPIDFHGRVVSEYRYHGKNISSGSAKMLIGTLAVHSAELSYVGQSQQPADAIAYETGRAAWIKFFGDRLLYQIMRQIQAKNWVAALGNHRLLLHYDPHLESIDREVYDVARSALFEQLAELPFESSLAYWAKQLDGGSGLLPLPLAESHLPWRIDCPRLAQPTFVGNSRSFELERELSNDLKTLSQQQGVTLENSLLATFKTLLYRYTGTEDIIVGIPTVDRRDAEIFVNAVAIRSNLAGNPSFADLLQQVQQTVSLAQPHQTVPIELIESLQLHVTLVFETDLEFDKIQLDRLTAMPWLIEADTAKFDLTLYLKQTSDGIAGQWIYNSDLFDATTIDRLHEHFQNLLAAIVANPNQLIAHLPMLTNLERQQLLGTHQPIPNSEGDRCLHHLFEAQVARNPDRIALGFEDQKITYQELNARANQLAHYLQSLGVVANQLVGLCVDRSLETIIGILGILKAGGAYLPLDPSNPPERSAYILTDAQVTILVTTSDLVASLASCVGDRVAFAPAIASALRNRAICLDTDLQKIETYSVINPDNTGQPNDLAYAIYTSGSTGQPKGVLVNHQNVARLFTATDDWYHFNERDVWTLFHSFAFDFSVWEIWGALLYGGKLVIVPYFVSRDPVAFYHLLASEQVTVLNQTPSAFYQLSKIDERLHLSNELSLRLIIFGGEALNLPSLESWFDRHGDTCPQLVNMYGITETTVHVTYQPLTRADLQSTGSLIGRPIPDLQIYLLDAYLQPVPIGTSGEMYVGGAGVAQGYWRRAELTRERFIPHPFSPDADTKLYRTGDLARYLPDGNLEYIGRIDHQVKIRGFRIELGEIEALLSQHPDLTENAVIVREDLPGDKHLVAYLVTHNQQLTTNKLQEFLAAQLPTYMIPAMFAIVPALPLTVNGKVDRRALVANKVESKVIGREPNVTANSSLTLGLPSLRDAIARANATLSPTAIASNLANPNQTTTPKKSTADILVAIWSQVLGRQQVGIDDNFFELGGHSISILQVAAGVQQQLDGIEIPVVKLFQYPTIAKLAAYLNGEQQSSQSNNQLKNRAEQQKAANARRRRG